MSDTPPPPLFLQNHTENYQDLRWEQNSKAIISNSLIKDFGLWIGQAS